MPIFRIGADLYYYAHVPKCAGSSVEDYLTARFGPLAFLDRRFFAVADRWSVTSPQHIDRHALERLFPEGFFKGSFTVVRHPATRLLSAYRFNQKQRFVSPYMSFSRWISGPVRDALRDAPRAMDNHLRPMTDLVPENAEVFRIEDGLDGAIALLDAWAGNNDGPRRFPTSNVTAPGKAPPRAASPLETVAKRILRPAPPVLTPRLLSTIHELYRADYARFGYTPDKLPG